MKNKTKPPMNMSLLPKGKQDKIIRSFFEYFMDHACVCSETWCICKASTFRDMICDPALRNDEKYTRIINEILEKIINEN